MGTAKRMGERHDELVRSALGILLREGYAEECGVHSDSYYEAGNVAFDEVLESVKTKKLWRSDGVSEDQLVQVFTDAMLMVGADECGFCANNRDRDD